MMRLWLAIGALNGFLAVALGAVGAHALPTGVDPDRLEVFEKAVRYQMWHALALLAVGLVAGRITGVLPPLAGTAFTVGIVLFCGSLYLIGLTGSRAVAFLAPIGGTSLLAGWLLLGAAALFGKAV